MCVHLLCPCCPGGTSRTLLARQADPALVEEHLEQQLQQLAKPQHLGQPQAQVNQQQPQQPPQAQQQRQKEQRVPERAPVQQHVQAQPQQPEPAQQQLPPLGQRPVARLEASGGGYQDVMTGVLGTCLQGAQSKHSTIVMMQATDWLACPLPTVLTACANPPCLRQSFTKARQQTRLIAELTHMFRKPLALLKRPTGALASNAKPRWSAPRVKPLVWFPAPAAGPAAAPAAEPAADKR